MLDQIITYDRDLFLLLNNLGNTNWDGFWLFITNKFSSIPLYLVLIWLSYKQFGLKRTLLIVAAALLMIVCTNGLADLFKNGLQRLRPCYDTNTNELMRLVKASCGGKFSYFSAHASNTMAIAVFFAVILKQKYKHIGLLLLLWAVLIAYSRIYIGVHFPLDILTGIFIGLFFGWLFVNLYTFILHKMSL